MDDGSSKNMDAIVGSNAKAKAKSLSKYTSSQSVCIIFRVPGRAGGLDLDGGFVKLLRIALVIPSRFDLYGVLGELLEVTLVGSCRPDLDDILVELLRLDEQDVG
jgi:hypothetical protein